METQSPRKKRPVVMRIKINDVPSDELLSFVFFVTGCLEIGYHDLTEDENDNSNKTDKPTTNIGRDSEQTLSACSDGMDNDGNGYIDCADYSCFKLSSNSLSLSIGVQISILLS